MIDIHVVLRAYLAGALYTTCGNRIYAGRDNPPSGYLPSQGNAIAFKTRDTGRDYEDAIQTGDFQFKCFGEDELDALTCYRALYDNLHNAKNSAILHAEQSGGGVPLEDPTTGWFYVLAYFSVSFTGV